jgi:hypothetical protein
VPKHNDMRLHNARRLGRRASERPGVGSTVELESQYTAFVCQGVAI